MYKLKHTKGYSLVEALVAVSILMLSIVGPMTIAAKGIQTGRFVNQQATAVYLAQEGIESVAAVRNQEALKNFGDPSAWDWAEGGGVLNACRGANGCNIEWDNSVDGATTNYSVTGCNSGASDPCHLYLSTNPSDRSQYTMLDDTGEQSLYTRVIRINDSGSDREVEVTSSVSWEANIFGGTRTVVLTSYLYNLYAN